MTDHQVDMDHFLVLPGGENFEDVTDIFDEGASGECNIFLGYFPNANLQMLSSRNEAR